MPEGDTIFRTAASIRTWLGGRLITGAQSSLPHIGVGRLVGRTVSSVDTVGKNLLLTFSATNPAETDLVLHTHMRMTGSWHVYPLGARWQRPLRQARVILEAGERVAVCFNAPVVELASAEQTQRRGALAGAGPDILVLPLDLVGIRRRVAKTDPDLALGELLLDQRLVAGIGNIYRCESLFLEGHHPWTPRRTLLDARLDALVVMASTLMRANLGDAGATTQFGREFGGGANRPWVYRRVGLPCRRCTTTIASKPQGEQARVAYWCPTCQPARPSGSSVRSV